MFYRGAYLTGKEKRRQVRLQPFAQRHAFQVIALRDWNHYNNSISILEVTYET
jgi:hypothetical protein